MVQILDAKYEKEDLPKLVKDNCAHLDSSQQEDLLALLNKYDALFDGTLGLVGKIAKMLPKCRRHVVNNRIWVPTFTLSPTSTSA